MVHVLGHYVDATLFWTVVPAALGVVIAVAVAIVVHMLSVNRRSDEIVRKLPDAMRRRQRRMTEYLDGLAGSESVVRQPFELGFAEMNACRWDKAIGYFQKAMTETKGVRLVALFNLTGVCHFSMGRPNDALRDFEESARLAEQFGDRQGKARVLGNIGLVYHDNGELDKALKYHEEALAMARGLDDRWAMAIHLGNTGDMCHDRGELDKALAYYEEALAISGEIGDQWGMATDLGNVGSIYRDKGELDKALQYHEEALATARNVGYKLAVASNLGSIGGIYRDKGRLDNALKYEEEALALAHELGYKLDVATTLGDIGLILADKRKHEQAVPKLAEALAILLAMGVADGPRFALTGLIRCEDRLGRKRMEKLLKGAGEDDGTIADVLNRIDMLRQRRPG